MIITSETPLPLFERIIHHEMNFVNTNFSYLRKIIDWRVIILREFGLNARIIAQHKKMHISRMHNLCCEIAKLIYFTRHAVLT